MVFYLCNGSNGTEKGDGSEETTMCKFLTMVIVLIGLAAKPGGAEDAVETAERQYKVAVDQAKGTLATAQKIYDEKVKAAGEVLVLKLKTEMASKTKIADLDGAMRIKARIQEIEVQQEKTLPDVVPNGWTLLFKSDKPEKWGNSTTTDQDFALSKDKFPKTIKYLMMRRDRGDYVIIELNGKQLCSISEQPEHGYGWNGTGTNGWNGYHLGIYLLKEDSTQGNVGINIRSNSNLLLGWGFGHLGWVGDKQGYSWNSNSIEKTKLEIFVTNNNLTETEQKRLLK